MAIEWESFLASFFSVALGSSAGGGLLLLAVRHLLSRSEERLKSELQMERDAGLERLRAVLRASAFEHETRFARFHERQLDVIAELYELLVDAEEKMNSLARPFQWAGEPSAIDKAQEAAQAGRAFSRQFYRRRIFLDADLARDLEAFEKTLNAAYTSFWLYLRQQQAGESGPPVGAMWQESWRKVGTEAPPIREKIEGRFRAILGVHDAIGSAKT